MYNNLQLLICYLYFLFLPDFTLTNKHYIDSDLWKWNRILSAELRKFRTSNGWRDGTCSVFKYKKFETKGSVRDTTKPGDPSTRDLIVITETSNYSKISWDKCYQKLRNSTHSREKRILLSRNIKQPPLTFVLITKTKMLFSFKFFLLNPF